MAPALAPVIASMASRPSSRMASSTPQVKAPCAPPPCKASDTAFSALGPASPRRAPPERARASAHCAVQPPSIDRLAPVIWLAASEHRKTASAATCSTVTNCLVGCAVEHDVVDDLLAGEAARLHGVGDLPLDERRPHIAGADAVDGDAVRRELERHGLGEAGDAVLGRDVGGLEGRGGEGMRRGGRDDAAPAAPLHAGHRRPDGVEGGRQVDGDDLVPLLGRELLDRRHVLDAGIVDEDVDRPEGCLGLPDHAGDLVRLRHVGRRMDGLDAELGLDAAPRALDLARIAEAVEDHVGAFFGHGPGDGEADAAGRAGHDRGFGAKHHREPPVLGSI